MRPLMKPVTFTCPVAECEHCPKLIYTYAEREGEWFHFDTYKLCHGKTTTATPKDDTIRQETFNHISQMEALA